MVILPLTTAQCPLSTVDDIYIYRSVYISSCCRFRSIICSLYVSSHQNTCLAQGSTRDTYRRVSIIATFTPNNGQSQQTQHFQLQCSRGTWNAITIDGFGTPSSNLTLRTGSFTCIDQYVPDIDAIIICISYTKPH